jgi:hypothetical protein
MGKLDGKVAAVTGGRPTMPPSATGALLLT